MIKHLSERIIEDRYGCVYGASAPNNRELMDKINELIEEVNKLKTKLEEEQK
jgi:predicted small metal-binding protein